MPYSTAGKNLMLNALRGVNPTTPITHVSAHTADPGDTGANEVTGAPYARQAAAFGAAAGGVIGQTGAPAIPIPGGRSVTHIGYWSAVSGGTFLGSDAIATETFGADGVLNLADADLDLNA